MELTESSLGSCLLTEDKNLSKLRFQGIEFR